MATPSKTVGTTLISHQAVTHPNSVVGSAVDVSTKFHATVYINHAPIEASANTNPPRFLVQASAAASGNEDWHTIEERICSDGTPATEALTGTESDNTLAVASTTGFNEDDIVYIQDVGTVTDGEWAYVKQITTDTTIDLFDNLTTTKDSSDVIWNQAEQWVLDIPLDGITRIRCVYQNEGATALNAHIKVTMTTLDSIS